jgi:pentatricopeptide repeat protein
VYAGKGLKADLRSTIADPIQPGDRRFSPKGKGAADDKAPGEDGEDLGYENMNTKGGELGRQKYEKRLEASVKRQLSLTTDPYHIALHVARVLEKGNFDEALMTARMASRNTKVEVSWNHLIDYQMKNRRLHAAVKLYNEVRMAC